MALDANYTATSYTTLVGAVDIRRTGNITGIDAETIVDLAIIPAFTFTEPGGGESTNYYGAHIDMSSAAVTAGGGSSVLSALNLVAGTDDDVGENWALTATGNLDISGYVDLDLTTTTAGGTKGIDSYVIHNTNALTGDVIGVYGNARVDINSPSGKVIGGYFRAGNGSDVTGYNVDIIRGVYVEGVKKTGSAAIDAARGIEVSMDWDAITTTTTTLTGCRVELQTGATASAPTYSSGIHVTNQSVSGAGQKMGSAILVTQLSCGSSAGFDYGLDLGNASFVDDGLTFTNNDFGIADIRTSSGAKIFTGSAANGDAVYAEVGAYDATGSIYLSTAAGAIYVQVADNGAAADWYKVTSTDAD